MIAYHLSCGSKKLIIHSEAPEELMIYADRNMISTVLRNLVSNAIKFTSENGEIFLKIDHAENQYTFQITDTGVGISEEDLKKLFRSDIHFQKKGTNKESGTGLGLLLIKNFVEMHSGNIIVESKQGKGTTFKFTAPLFIDDAVA